MPEYYGTLAGFKAYHLARGNDIAARDDDEYEADLLVASEWLDARFRSQFPGVKAGGREQMREWERVGASDIYGNTLESIPREVEHATYEAAAIHGATPGALSVNWTPGKYSQVSIDGALSVTYAKITNLFEAQAQFAIVQEVLSPVLTGSAFSGMLTGLSVRG